MSLFSNHCGGCGKSIPTYATNRQGDVPTVFCNRACETVYNQEKRMADHKTFVPFKQGLTTNEVTQRMSQSPWHRNHGGQYILKNQVDREEIAV